MVAPQVIIPLKEYEQLLIAKVVAGRNGWIGTKIVMNPEEKDPTKEFSLEILPRELSSGGVAAPYKIAYMSHIQVEFMKGYKLVFVKEEDGKSN